MNESKQNKNKSGVLFGALLMGSSFLSVPAVSLAHDDHTTANLLNGQQIFQQRCVLCHGVNGEGDGRMAKVIKEPPPFDLTASRIPDEYMKDIIAKGSEAMGRSKHMPPWGDSLTEVQIEAVMLYIKALRD